ncbi:MAG: hypothetical protein KIC73_01135 [Clostridiales bacterium]|jgi:hypothetical protein|nr:hypothetical protein [Clostridiales bacterium]
MIIKGVFQFNKAIKVDEDLLRELQVELEDFSNDFTLKALLENGNEIYFDSLEEMLVFDNYGNRKIKRLNLRLSMFFNIDFTNTIALFSSYKNTIQAQYTCNKPDESIIIDKKLHDIFNKGKLPLYYRLLTKFSIKHILVIILMWYAIQNLRAMGKVISDQNITIKVFNIIAISAMILFFITTKLEEFKNIIFPSIVFYWGKEKERFDKHITYADKIFWGIVIAFLAPVLYKQILQVFF